MSRQIPQPTGLGHLHGRCLSHFTFFSLQLRHISCHGVKSQSAAETSGKAQYKSNSLPPSAQIPCTPILWRSTKDMA
eukprot:3936095-Rhodomonas_salina.2